MGSLRQLLPPVANSMKGIQLMRQITQGIRDSDVTYNLSKNSRRYERDPCLLRKTDQWLFEKDYYKQHP
jgi:hypothetical protein